MSIIGPSGCGKSTLFNVIAGLAKPTAGNVLADGQSIVGKNGYVGYMLEKGLLLPWRTILDNIILGMEVRDVPRTDAIARAMPLIQRYGLTGFEQHYPHELSTASAGRPTFLDAGISKKSASTSRATSRSSTTPIAVRPRSW